MKVTFKAIGTDRLGAQTEFDLAEGASLKDLMQAIDQRFGPDAVAGLLSVNSRLVYQDEAAETELHDGDQVLVAPPLSGG